MSILNFTRMYQKKNKGKTMLLDSCFR